MRELIAALLIVQVLTFVAFGAYLLSAGYWRLGVAQVLLSVVQAVIYSEGIPQ